MKEQQDSVHLTEDLRGVRGATPASPAEVGQVCVCAEQGVTCKWCVMQQMASGAEDRPLNTTTVEYQKAAFLTHNVDDLMQLVFRYGAARCEVDRSNTSRNQRACNEAIDAIREYLRNLTCSHGHPVMTTPTRENEHE